MYMCDDTFIATRVAMNVSTMNVSTRVAVNAQLELTHYNECVNLRRNEWMRHV